MIANDDYLILLAVLQGREQVLALPTPLPVTKPAQPRTLAAGPDLKAIIDLVRAAACEVSGTEMDETAHFASHHFDSLAAVELANLIGKTVGLSLPSKLR